jgi:hypothetical protein
MNVVCEVTSHYATLHITSLMWSSTLGMEIQAVAITLNRDDDAGKGGRIRGNLFEHLPERLPGRFAEHAEFLGMVFENGTQKFWDCENKLGVADLLEDVCVEPLGKKQDAFLLTGGTKKPAFAGVGQDSLIAATVTAKPGETSMKVSTVRILAHYLADDGAPVAVLLLVAVIVDPLELLVIVFHQRIQ